MSSLIRIYTVCHDICRMFWTHYCSVKPNCSIFSSPERSSGRAIALPSAASSTSALANCTARQCSPLRRKFMECSIINPALSLLMKHLVIGQRQRASNFSAFHRSPHGCLVSIGQHFVTTRVVHLSKRTETSLITESDRSEPNHRIGPGCAGRA